MRRDRDLGSPCRTFAAFFHFEHLCGKGWEDDGIPDEQDDFVGTATDRFHDSHYDGGDSGPGKEWAVSQPDIGRDFGNKWGPKKEGWEDRRGKEYVDGGKPEHPHR